MGIVLLASLLLAVYDVTLAIPNNHPIEFTTDGPPIFATNSGVPNYIVGIALGPAPEVATEYYFNITDANQTQYVCVLPTENDDALEETSVDFFLVGDAQLHEEAPDAENLLESLRNLCAYRIEGWWTYEVCYKKHIRQYHTERKKISQEQYLGRFDAASSDVTAVLEDKTSLLGNQKYVSHHFSGGDLCELTEEERSAEVRYFCSDTAQDTIVSSIRESSTCNYVLTIKTPVLCKHPAFREPPPKVKSIMCYVTRQGEGGASGGEEGTVESEKEDEVDEVGMSCRDEL